MSKGTEDLIKRITELEARLAAAEARIAMLEARPTATLSPPLPHIAPEQPLPLPPYIITVTGCHAPTYPDFNEKPTDWVFTIGQHSVSS